MQISTEQNAPIVLCERADPNPLKVRRCKLSAAGVPLSLSTPSAVARRAGRSAVSGPRCWLHLLQGDLGHLCTSKDCLQQAPGQGSALPKRGAHRWHGELGPQPHAALRRRLALSRPRPPAPRRDAWCPLASFFTLLLFSTARFSGSGLWTSSSGSRGSSKRIR